MAIYAAVVPGLLQVRMDFIRKRLVRLAAKDVTFIACANRADVDMLSLEERVCLHPYLFENTPWTAPQKGLQSAPSMRNGTLSLALKHALAYLDVIDRRIPAAIVLEDDANVPLDLWTILAQYHVPCDASVFWMSAYRMALDTYALKPLARGNNSEATLVMTDGRHLPIYKRRDNNTHHGRFFQGELVSAAGYIIFERGARSMLSHPVLAPADVGLSCLLPSCVGNDAQPGLGAPWAQYGPAKWLFGQASGMGGATHLGIPPPPPPPQELESVPGNAINSTLHAYDSRNSSTRRRHARPRPQGDSSRRLST